MILQLFSLITTHSIIYDTQLYMILQLFSLITTHSIIYDTRRFTHMWKILYELIILIKGEAVLHK